MPSDKSLTDFQFPSADAFRRACGEFCRREPRQPMYRVATRLVKEWWSNPSDLADALGVLLLTWNQAHYRYGSFSFERLEACIAANKSQLELFRARSFLSFQSADESVVISLFGAFNDALAISAGKSQGRKSPVATAKALHLLAPGFFPLWDKAIARAYQCDYAEEPERSYLRFYGVVLRFAGALGADLPTDPSVALKLIDEYNYSTYTKGWIR